MAARLLSIPALLISSFLFAAHLPGASITYECLGGNQYLVTLQTYRECSGAAMIPQSLKFTGSCGSTFTVNNLLPVDSSEVSQLCPADLPNSTCNGGILPGIVQYRYELDLFLANCATWVISWEICCRQASINVVGTPGLYVESVMKNILAPCNNSPQFTDNTLPYVCVGQPASYNFGVVATDGDSIHYSLIEARYASPGPTPVAYEPPYSGAEPFTGMTLDASTGQVNFTPTIIGYVVVVVLVEEFNANGVLIGSVMRDIPFVVINCPNNVPDPTTGTITNLTGTATLTSSQSLQLCEGGQFCFDAVITDPDAGQLLTLTTNAGTVLPGTNFSVSGTNPATATICWSAGIGSGGSYSFILSAQDNACPLTAVQTYAYTVNVFAGTSAGADAEICPGDTAQLNALGGTTFSWSVVSGDPISVGVNFSCDDCADPEASPAVTTVYAVQSDLSPSCNSDTVTVVVLPSSDPDCITTTIHSGQQPAALYLSPNPTNGILYLSGSAINAGNTVEVYDALGKLRAMERVTASSSGMVLQLPADLAPGRYVIRSSGPGADARLMFDLIR
mgnify:FL=1